jgi:hypothetical protein
MVVVVVSFRPWGSRVAASPRKAITSGFSAESEDCGSINPIAKTTHKKK